MPVNIVETVNLSVKYQEIEALAGITFSVSKGDYVGIVGPNGSGKTTLIKTLLGLVGYYSGQIKLYGRDIRLFRDWQKIGYLPQKLAFLDPRFPATVKEVIASGLLSRKKFPRKFNSSDYALVESVSSILEISGLLSWPVGKLSGGQQQRVLLARALVHNPQMLILDEPTVALDPQSRENFYNAVEKLNKEQNISILLVTHDIGTIGRYASKLLYLDRKLIFYGNFEDFCMSETMTDHFGSSSQHIICHRHK